MKKVLTILLSLAVVVAIAQQRTEYIKPVTHDPGACPSLVVTPVDNVVTTAIDLVETILGPDVASYNVTFFAAEIDAVNGSAGLFQGGTDAGIGIEEGIMLSSGYIRHAIGPNSTSEVSVNMGNAGDADLSALVGGNTYDATVLQFDFVPNFDQLYIQYVLGSDEYNEWLGYNDVFGFFLNGSNIALIPSTTTPVSISNINPFTNPAYFKNNDTPPYPYCNEMDGMTIVMTATGNVNEGVSNTIKLAVSDAYDAVLDTFVFIKGESFSGVDPEVPVSNWALFIGIGLILVFAVIRFRRLV